MKLNQNSSFICNKLKNIEMIFEPYRKSNISGVLSDIDSACVCIHDLISLVLSDEIIAKEVAERSYIHDNGFIKVVFIQQDCFPNEVRVHIWKDGDLGGNHTERCQNIHNHSANFYSLVIAGQAEEEFFLESGTAQRDIASEGGNVYRKYSCGSRGEKSFYNMVFENKAAIKSVGSEILRPGCVHVLEYMRLHRINIISYPFITMFIQGDRRQSGTIVFSKEEYGHIERLPSPPLSVERLKEVLNWLSGFIEVNFSIKKEV